MGGLTPLAEFSLPRSLAEASYKISENVFEYVGNYLLVALVAVCCVLYTRPVALVGLLVTGRAWEWLRTQAEAQAAAAGGGGAVGGGREGRGAAGTQSTARQRQAAAAAAASAAAAAAAARQRGHEHLLLHGGWGGSPVRGGGSLAPDGAGGDAAASGVRRPTRIDQAKQLGVTLGTWAVLMRSRVVPALLLAAAVAAAAVLLHGLLRNPHARPARGRWR